LVFKRGHHNFVTTVALTIIVSTTTGIHHYDPGNLLTLLQLVQDVGEVRPREVEEDAYGGEHGSSDDHGEASRLPFVTLTPLAHQLDEADEDEDETYEWGDDGKVKDASLFQEAPPTSMMTAFATTTKVVLFVHVVVLICH